MKTIAALLCLLTNINLQAMNSNQLEIHFKESIQFRELTITWNFFAHEQAVEANGDPGPHAALIGFQIQSADEKTSWELTLPADYNELFQKDPNRVTFRFKDYTFQITGADLNSFDHGFVRFKITSSTPPEFQIDFQSVSEEKFLAFQKTLSEVKGTWYCAETTEGGITGYDMTDKKGNVYKFRAKSGKNGSVTSLTRNPR